MARIRPSASPSGHALQHFAPLIQTEGLPEDGSIGALQGVARVRRDRVPGREHDATLLPPSREPQLLEQVEAGVLVIEVHVEQQGVEARARLLELPRRGREISYARYLVPQPLLPYVQGP